MSVGEGRSGVARRGTDSDGSGIGSVSSRCSSPTKDQNSSTEHAALPPTSIQLSQLLQGCADVVESAASSSASTVDDAPTSISATRSSHILLIPSIRTLASLLATATLKLSSKPRSFAKFGICASDASSNAIVSLAHNRSGASGLWLAKMGLIPLSA